MYIRYGILLKYLALLKFKPVNGHTGSFAGTVYRSIDQSTTKHKAHNFRGTMAVIKDGTKETPIEENSGGSTSDQKPILPFPASEEQDEGAIFVSIPSYRDGERCGATLKALFENAKRPEKVFVGVIEQNHANDRFCIEEYCSFYGMLLLLNTSAFFCFDR